MSRISWFKRLFMSYDALATHFAQSTNGETLITVKNTYTKLLENQETTIADLRSQLDEVRTKAIQFEEGYKNQKNNNESKDNNIKVLNQKVNELQVRLDERTKETNIIRDDIRDQLKTIGKIESTFFAKSGNKGKGELGERQVKTILEKSGLPADMWIENLQVNSNIVEFAMQSGEEGKFIPIDSKVLDTEQDEEGNINVNSAYKTKVETQVKEVKKYLGKSNTADYGIIVLQSDDVYMKLFEEYPQFFSEMIEKHRIYVNSPSSFVQTAWSISNLLKIYKRVKKDERIYEEMQDALVSVGKFATSLSKVHKDFNIAMETHYPTIEKRHANLVKRLDKEGKLKAIPEVKGDK